MRVRKITTASEAQAEEAFRRVLAGSEWAVALKLPIQEAVDRQGARLTEDEFSMYTRGHLDFVVYREREHLPCFAVEFDGFGHEEARQVARDVIKNRFCAEAGLPLLRIGMSELSASDSVSVLEWLLERFVAWEAGAPHIGAELVRSGVDPERDPMRARSALVDRFHNEALFPANWAAVLRLHDEFGIAPQIRGQPNATPSARYTLEIDWPGDETFEDAATSEYVVVTMSAELRELKPNAVCLFSVTGRARFAWANKVRPGVRRAETAATLQLTAKEWIERGLAPQVLPWLDPSSIASEIATYQLLGQAARWARLNLSKA